MHEHVFSFVFFVLIFTLRIFFLVGEKYELAKKMKKIKLVNHRWLEDWFVLTVIFSPLLYH